MKVKCVVAVGFFGVRTLWPCIVEATQGQIDNGEHYNVAKNAAIDDGYSCTYIVFDENDEGFSMINGIDWNTIKTFSI